MPGWIVWWSGKHAAHGGNVQIIAAPNGGPIKPVFTHRRTGALDHTVGEPGASDIRYRVLGAAAAGEVRCDRGVPRERRAQPHTVRAKECSPLTRGICG